MKLHAELARLSAEAYLPSASVAIGDDLAAVITGSSAGTIVAFRGTANAAGWLRDLRVLPTAHPMIGYCHRGFLLGASDLMQVLTLPTERPVIFTGHSLGGAIAIVLGALRLAAGERVDQLVTFGAPRAGYSKLAEIWAGSHSVYRPAVTQYRNGNDPVPQVPFRLTAFPYQHVRDPVAIGAPDPVDPFNCHSIRLYAALVDDLPEPNQENDGARSTAG